MAGRRVVGLVLIDDHLGVMVFDRVEGGHEKALEALHRVGLGVDDLLVALEQPVEESTQYLINHRSFEAKW